MSIGMLTSGIAICAYRFLLIMQIKWYNVIMQEEENADGDEDRNSFPLDRASHVPDTGPYLGK
ncbi:5251_t:CDS:2 [Rhizophagus irregularis]|nr:5251_t:CDS:2 [Rhizophagus irregularis]